MSLRWMIGATAAILFSSSVTAEAASEAVTLRARDGVSISGLAYTAEHPKAIVLLFHQAESSKAEYATIAPRLAAAGFTALAVDQRSGGSLYGPNETARRLGKEAGYEQAKPDLEAALDWATAKHLPVVLWGSSYSASLVFEVAADHPQEVSAVMAFSPGEYFDDKDMVKRAAGKIAVPFYVTTRPEEEDKVDEVLRNAHGANVTHYRQTTGVHGASTLVQARDPQGYSANLRSFTDFLRRALPPENP